MTLKFYKYKKSLSMVYIIKIQMRTNYYTKMELNLFFKENIYVKNLMRKVEKTMEKLKNNIYLS